LALGAKLPLLGCTMSAKRSWPAVSYGGPGMAALSSHTTTGY
jgi:hypothetical protein